jgi:hypothetical protein
MESPLTPTASSPPTDSGPVAVVATYDGSKSRSLAELGFRFHPEPGVSTRPPRRVRGDRLQAETGCEQHSSGGPLTVQPDSPRCRSQRSASATWSRPGGRAPKASRASGCRSRPRLCATVGRAHRRAITCTRLAAGTGSDDEAPTSPTDTTGSVLGVRQVRRTLLVGRFQGMRVRGVLIVLGVVVIVAGCGGSAGPSRDSVIHLNGKRVAGNYVFETDASGARFIVPAPVLAGQGNQTFDVAASTTATIGEPADTVLTAPAPYRAVVSSANAVVPHSARVEILTTGEPGRQFSLSWEETCWSQAGNNTAGQGIETLRTPAVALVKLPRVNGPVSSCYLAATASAKTLSRRVRLAIIDY